MTDVVVTDWPLKSTPPSISQKNFHEEFCFRICRLLRINKYMILDWSVCSDSTIISEEKDVQSCYLIF